MEDIFKGVTPSVPVPEVHRDVLILSTESGWMLDIGISPDPPAESGHVDVLLGELTHTGCEEVAGGVPLNVPAAPWVVVGPGLQAYPPVRRTEGLRSNHILIGQKEVLGAASHQLVERRCSTKPGVGSCISGSRASKYLSRISSTVGASSLIRYLSFVLSANRGMAIATIIIMTSATVRTVLSGGASLAQPPFSL
jgi:hypothetical protein